MSQNLKQRKTTLFADDTVLTFSAKSVIDLKKRLTRN